MCMYVCYLCIAMSLVLYWCEPTQVVYNCIQQEFVLRVDMFHIVVVSFEVSMYIHIQIWIDILSMQKMPFSVLFLASLALSYLPLSLSYQDGARSESCYNMLVMHTDFTGQTVPPMECGNQCPYDLRVVGRVNAENASNPMEITYQFGETYHCK